MFRVINCDIGISALSDHNPVYLYLNLNGKIKSTLWRLNTNILNDKEIMNKLKFEIESYLEYNDNDAVSPVILWDALWENYCNFFYGKEIEKTKITRSRD